LWTYYRDGDGAGDGFKGMGKSLEGIMAEKNCVVYKHVRKFKPLNNQMVEETEVRVEAEKIDQAKKVFDEVWNG